MSFLRKVAGAFIELPEETVQPTFPAPTRGAPPMPLPQMPGRPASSSTVDQDMVDILTAVSLKRQTAYTAFIEASKKLEAVLPDENTRIRAAFVTVNGEGRSLEQMLQAIDIHAMDVDSEVDKFIRTAESNAKTEVDAVNLKANSLIKENDDIERQITDRQNQIADLTARKQENSTTSQNLFAQATDAEHKISSVKFEFTKAADYVRENLADRKAMLSALITK